MTPKLLLANPNTSAAMTVRMTEVARRVARERAAIVGTTAPFGAAALESEEDLRTAELAVLSMIGADETCDGVLIAAFGDPGLSEARAAGRVPVEVLGESGLLEASEHGRRFSILTLGPALRPSIEARVGRLGLSGQLASIDFLDCSVLDLATHPERHLGEISVRVKCAKTQAGAEAVLLAGAPFAGLAEALSQYAPLPLHEGVSAGIRRLLAGLP